MNIFVLDKNITKSAQYHVDKHIVKMPLETAQMLCTAHQLNSNNAPYKATHINHPCNVWVRKTLDNYLWLVDFGLELCKEYTYRYGKVHKCQKVIKWCKQNLPNLSDNGLTRFAEAMPDEYKTKDPIDSYRNYYASDKQHLFSWKKREEPWWIDLHLTQLAFS